MEINSENYLSQDGRPGSVYPSIFYGRGEEREHIKAIVSLFVMQRQTVGWVISQKEASKFRWLLHMGRYALKQYSTFLKIRSFFFFILRKRRKGVGSGRNRWRDIFSGVESLPFPSEKQTDYRIRLAFEGNTLLFLPQNHGSFVLHFLQWPLLINGRQLLEISKIILILECLYS